MKLRLGTLRRLFLSLCNLGGYWIEYVCPGSQSREEEFGVIYHEGTRELTFLGVRRPKPEIDVLFVPSASSWASRVEPWARSRRVQILDRLLCDPRVQRCEIRSYSLP